MPIRGDFFLLISRGIKKSPFRGFRGQTRHLRSSDNFERHDCNLIRNDVSSGTFMDEIAENHFNRYPLLGRSEAKIPPRSVSGRAKGARQIDMLIPIRNDVSSYL